MESAITLRFSTQAQSDIQRMTQQLSDLQRQVASGAKADDLRGFGAGAAQLLNAQTLKATTDSRSSVINELQARRERLDAYQAKARYAVADSYDRAARLQADTRPDGQQTGDVAAAGMQPGGGSH